jgi:rubrerythrin
MQEIISTIKNNDVVLDAALKFHEYSTEIYRELADNISNSDIKNLLNSLSLQDEKFYFLINKLIENKSGSAQNSTNLVGEYGTYINLILTRIIPQNIKHNNLSEKEILKAVILFEEKKNEFYEHTSKFFTFADQEHLNSLCGEILLRINLLKKLLNSLES